MAHIDYRHGNELDLDEVLDLYRASTLGERRPIDDRAVFRDMITNANLTITAWEGDLLVGIARTMTDFSYVGYLSDLAVRQSHQRMGIGLGLVLRTRQRMGPKSTIVLLSAPAVVDYYPRIGFTRHESAWVLHASQPLGEEAP